MATQRQLRRPIYEDPRRRGKKRASRLSRNRPAKRDVCDPSRGIQRLIREQVRLDCPLLDCVLGGPKDSEWRFFENRAPRYLRSFEIERSTTAAASPDAHVPWHKVGGHSFHSCCVGRTPSRIVKRPEACGCTKNIETVHAGRTCNSSPGMSQRGVGVTPIR